VLCIEDEPDMINLIKLTLERGGFRAIGALGGRQGLDIARRVKPDVVLLDLMMPDMSGWEVARRLRADESLKGVRIVVLSVIRPNGRDRQELPVDDYVTKPFAPDDLVRRLWEALDLPANRGKRKDVTGGASSACS
jgi:DNA-binding response OmpR family regulator